MPAWLTARSEGIDLAADGEVVSARLSGQRTQGYLLVDHLRWPSGIGARVMIRSWRTRSAGREAIRG